MLNVEFRIHHSAFIILITMHWLYTPYTSPLFVAAAVSAGLAVYAWRRRPTTGATPFAVLMLAVAEWALAYAFELGGLDLPTIVLGLKIEYAGIVTVPVAWLAVVLQYTGREKWLTRRNLILLAIIPLTTLLLAWTNEIHGLIWREIILDTGGPLSVPSLAYEVWAWVHTAYSYLLLLLGTLLLIQAFLRSPHLYRRQAGTLLIGVLVSWVGNALYISGLSPFPHLDLTPFAFTLSGVAVAWGLFRYRLLDIVPVARDAVIEGMSDGVIVLDAQNRIVDFNLAAQRLIGRTASEAIGQPLDISDFGFRISDWNSRSSKFEIRNPKSEITYDVRVSPLSDRHGRLTGRLIVLRDITDRKRTEEQEKRLWERMQRQHETLIRLSTHLALAEGRLDEALPAIAEATAETLEMERVNIWQLSPDGRELRCLEAFERSSGEHSAGQVLQAEKYPNYFAALEAGLVVDATDVTTDPRTAELTADYWESLGVSSCLDAPIRLHGKVVGVVCHEQVGPPRTWNPDEAVFASQVADLIAQTFLNTDIRRRTTELEALHEISLDITAQLELSGLLQSIVRRAAELMGASGGSLYLYHPEQEELELVVSHNLAADYNGTRLEVGEGMSGRVVATGQPLIVEDHRIWEGRAAAFEDAPFTAVISVPLHWQERVLGVISVMGLDERRSFAEQDLHLLEAFAHQAAISIENARLHEEVRQRLEQLDVLYRVAEAGSRTLELQPLLERLLDRILAVTGMQAGAIYRLNQAAQQLHLVAHRGLPSEFVTRVKTYAPGQGVTGRALASGQPAICEDALTVPELREKARQGGIRSQISLPLEVGGEIIGVLNLNSKEPRTWAQDEMRWLETIARQAAVGIENARLFDAAEQRATELEALRQVSLSLITSLELVEVLDAILEGTFKLLTGAEDAHIFLYQDEDDRLTFGAARWAEGFEGQPITEPRPDGFTYTVAREGEPIVVPNARTHPLFTGAYPDWEGAIVGLPLKIGQRVVGVMNVAYPEPHAFSKAELRALRLLGDQAAIAIENARLFEEARRRAEDSTALLDIARAVTSTLDLTQLLKQIALRTAQTCQANRCTIFLVDPSGERLEPIMSQFADGHADRELWRRFRTTTADRIDAVPLFRQVLHQRRPTILEDIPQGDMLPRKWIEPFGLQKVLAVPLVSRDRAIGVMVLDREDPARRFSQEQVDLAVAIAGQVAIAIENAQLFEAEQAARRHAETLRKAAATLGATLELEELLNRVLEELQQVVPYDSASVQLLRDDQLEIIAGRGFPEPEKVIGLTFPLAGDNPNKDVIARKRPVLIPDAYAAYAAFKEDPHSHIRSWLGAPLLSRDQVIGMITLDRSEVDAFSEEEADIALAFANHVAIALENARLYEATRRQAVTDGLTGLYNVRYFYQMLEKELERSRRYQHPCSLIMLDLDDFKKYNDRYGHLAGDDLLQELADLIRGEIRQTDTAARYGGEEFAVILPETDGGQAPALAERLRETVRDHEFVVRGTQRVGRITVSLGMATYPEDARDVEGLVDAADMALLRAKEEKDRVCVAAELAPA